MSYATKSSYALLIETATERGLVALVKGSEVIQAIPLPFGLQNSKTLLPTIDFLLKEHSVLPKELSFVGVGVGPGSYTGLRVGVAAAKGIAFACNLPLIAFSSLEAFMPEEPDLFAVMFDAKIGGAYLLEKGGTSKVLPLEEITLDPGTIVITPQANPLRKKWEKLYPELHLNWVEQGPIPQKIAKIAWEKWEKKEYSPDGEVEIQYLRKTQAEIEKTGN